MLPAAISRRIAFRLTHTNGLAKDMLMRLTRLALGLSTAAAGLAVTLGFAPLAAAEPGTDDTLMPCEVVGGGNECEGNNSELVDIPSNLGVVGPEESEPVWGMIGW